MIYLVEDDESIRELVVYTLKSQGMDAKGFERPSLFWKELEKEVPALILLDIMLPEEDGISILRKLRTRPDTRKIPVIMLTAKGAEEYHLENLYLCPGRHIVTVDQEPVNLTLKEYEMLVLLLKNSGMVLSRTQLLNQIWGYEFDGESRTVDVHIRTLR